LDSICAGLPWGGCDMIPTPSLFALPSRPMAIMAAGFEMDDLEVVLSRFLISTQPNPTPLNETRLQFSILT